MDFHELTSAEQMVYAAAWAKEYDDQRSCGVERSGAASNAKEYAEQAVEDFCDKHPRASAVTANGRVHPSDCDHPQENRAGNYCMKCGGLVGCGKATPRGGGWQNV